MSSNTNDCTVKNKIKCSKTSCTQIRGDISKHFVRIHYNSIYEALVASNDKKFTIQSLVINNFKHLLISEHAYLVIMNMIEMHKASFVLCSPGEPTLQTKLQPVPTSKISMSCFHGHQWIQNSLLKK